MAQFDPRTLAPLISLAATWAVKKGLAGAYKKKTGEAPPARTDANTPIANVLLWAGITALTTALIDVLIQRAAATYEQRQIASHPHDSEESPAP